MLLMNKIYGTPPNEAGSRYIPAKCFGIKIAIQNGSPDPGHISTSYVERSNLSIRNAGPPIHEIDECVQQKDYEPCGSVRALHDVLQFLKSASNIARDSGNGRRCRRSHLGNRRD